MVGRRINPHRHQLAISHQPALRDLQSPAGVFIMVFVMTECPTCGSDPCAKPSFCRACRAADRKARGERLRHAPLHPAPPPIEAVIHAVRERGLAALKEPVTAKRLERCDAAAKAEIEQRIAKLRKD
jgi:hypothetical protein